MSRSLSYIFPAGNTTDVCLLQSLVGAGNLTINGNLANLVNGQVSFIQKGYSRQISLTSTNDLSARQFTITGMQNGITITENITGPNNNTVYSVQVYDVINSISVNGTAAAVSVGTGWQGFFPLIAINLERDVTNYTLTLARLTVASVSFSVYGTLDNIVNNKTYSDHITNNSNLFQIQAPSTTANYVYSGLTGTYTYILVQLGATAATIANSMKLNFIQI
jgi:hypothetical protein